MDHSGAMGSKYTNHMWRFQGPDKFTRLLIICVSRERNVIHRHLHWQFLAWHSCDLLRFRHDVLEIKSTLNKKWKACYRCHITTALHFKNQFNIGSQDKRKELKKNLSNVTKHTPTNENSMHNTHHFIVCIPNRSQSSFFFQIHLSQIRIEIITSVWFLSLKANLDTLSVQELRSKEFILYNRTGENTCKAVWSLDR